MTQEGIELAPSEINLLFDRSTLLPTTSLLSVSSAACLRTTGIEQYYYGTGTLQRRPCEAVLTALSEG